MLKKVIKHWFRPRNENSARYRMEFADRLNGMVIKYVTERIDNEDIVIGRDGMINRKDDEILVVSDMKVVFRSKIVETRLSELLSLNGAVLTGCDLEHDGRERTVIAHYEYHRK